MSHAPVRKWSQGKGEYDVCVYGDGGENPVAVADCAVNAELIAAAPELLAIVRQVHGNCFCLHDKGVLCELCEKALAAIAKAERAAQ